MLQVRPYTGEPSSRLLHWRLSALWQVSVRVLQLLNLDCGGVITENSKNSLILSKLWAHISCSTFFSPNSFISPGFHLHFFLSNNTSHRCEWRQDRRLKLRTGHPFTSFSGWFHSGFQDRSSLWSLCFFQSLWFAEVLPTTEVKNSLALYSGEVEHKSSSSFVSQEQTEV